MLEGMLLMEERSIERGLNPGVVAGRVGRDNNWKKIGSRRRCWKGWKGRQLEGLDLDVVDRRDYSWKRWKGRQLEGEWKGWIRTLLMEGTLDPDIVAGGTLLIFPIDVVAVDCSNQSFCCCCC